MLIGANKMGFPNTTELRRALKKSFMKFTLEFFAEKNNMRMAKGHTLCWELIA